MKPLISDPSLGSTRFDVKPHIDATGSEGDNKCVKLPISDLASDKKLTFTVDLQGNFFIHAFALQHSIDYNTPPFDNYEVHVGAESDWSKNPPCANGPFIGKGNSVTDSTGSGYVNGRWIGGAEVWCNLPGRYVTVDADLSYLNGWSQTTSTDIYLCLMGIMGTKYAPQNPLTTAVTVADDEQKVMDVYYARASPEVGNPLNIKLR